MSGDYRPTVLIEEELSRVRSLIQKNNELLISYPDDGGLKLNLYSLHARESELVYELKGCPQ